MGRGGLEELDIAPRRQIGRRSDVELGDVAAEGELEPIRHRGAVAPLARLIPRVAGGKRLPAEQHRFGLTRRR
jgi:hypothetical protein